MIVDFSEKGPADTIFSPWAAKGFFRRVLYANKGYPHRVKIFLGKWQEDTLSILTLKQHISY